VASTPAAGTLSQPRSAGQIIYQTRHPRQESSLYTRGTLRFGQGVAPQAGYGPPIRFSEPSVDRAPFGASQDGRHGYVLPPRLQSARETRPPPTVQTLVLQTLPDRPWISTDSASRPVNPRGVVFKNVTNELTDANLLVHHIVPFLARHYAGVVDCPVPTKVFARQAFPGKEHCTIFVEYATAADARVVIETIGGIDHRIAGRRVYVESIYRR
jgi:hypothetical protein